MSGNGDYVSKILPPRISGVLSRPRLNERIKGIDANILWISGLAGSGKTTLAAQFVAQDHMPCLWYQLDRGDADPSTLFHYLRLALKRVRPRLRRLPPLLKPTSTNDLEVFTLRFFEKLFALLCTEKHGQPRSAVMVLDDFQNIQGSTVHDLLRAGLSVVPENAKVLVLSREAPPACFARLRACHAMTVWDGEDLLFSEAETEAFFDMQPESMRLPRESVRLVHEMTQGWTAGVRLLGEALPRSVHPLTAKDLPRETIFDFFQQELFAQLKPQTRDFLLKTALFPSMTARLAQALTGLASSQDLLPRLSANNFFVVQYPGQVRTYSYHQLFREFLLAQGRLSFSPAQLALLRRNAAAILRAAGRPEDAADLYILGGEEELLADLIQEQAPVMLAQERRLQLRLWLEQVSTDTLRRLPWLGYWKALTVLPTNIQEGRALLEHAVEEFTHQGDIMGACQARAEILTTCLMDIGMLPSLERHFQRLIAEIGSTPCTATPEIEAKVVLGLVLGITFSRPDHPHARHWVERGGELLHADIPIDQKINLGLNLLIYHIYMGYPPEAERIYLKLGTLAGHQEISDLARVQWLLLEAMHAHLVNPRPGHCRKTVERGLALAEASGIHAFDVFLLSVAAYMAVNMGDQDELKRLKMRLAPLVPMAPLLGTVNYHCMLCCEQLGLGNGDDALQQGRLALETLPLPRSPLPTACVLLGLAEACIEAGKWPEARSYLKQARRLTVGIKGFGGFGGGVLFLFPVAYAAFCRGRERVGLRVLRNAFARGREGGWLNALYWRPRQLSLLCARALESGVETEYAMMLVSRYNLRPLMSGSPRDVKPPPLEIRTLGSLEILRDKTRIDLPCGGSSKALTLLAAIIVLGAQDVPEEAIWDCLWPETDGDRAASSLKFTLHGLRKLLGTPKAVVLKGHRLSLNPQVCGIDLLHFEKARARVEEAAGGDTPVHRQITLCQEAIALYTGDFLARNPLPWVMAKREKLKNSCLKIFARLIDLYEQVGDVDEALQTCEQALTVDPLREEFHIRLIRLHLQAGRRIEARSMLERCQNVFHAELGRSPSRGVRDLIESG